MLVAKERLQRLARRRRARSRVWRLHPCRQRTAFSALTSPMAASRCSPSSGSYSSGCSASLVFAYAEREGAFKPNSPVVLRSPEWTLCGLGRSEQRFLASTQQMSYGLRRDRARPSSPASGTSGRRRAIRPSMPGCIRSTRCCPCSTWVRRPSGFPIRTRRAANSPSAISTSSRSSAGRLSLLAVAGFLGTRQIAMTATARSDRDRIST